MSQPIIRFCRRGHDKLAPNGFYQKYRYNKYGKLIKMGLQCKQCQRERSKAVWRKNHPK
jgi:hypothetical protein